MQKGREGASERAIFGRAFWLELSVYAALVFGYLLLVLRTLDRPLADLFTRNRPGYAVAALVLMLAQGVLLEWLTSVLLRFFRRRRT